MATNENISMVKQVYDCFNRRDWDGAMKLLRKEVEWNNVPGGQKFSGPDGAVEFWRGWADSFSDGKVEVTRILAANDFALAEGRFVGTQNGEFRGPMGNVPASNKRCEMTFCEIFEFKNGKVLRAHAYPDHLTLMRQIGAFEGRAAESWASAQM